MKQLAKQKFTYFLIGFLIFMIVAVSGFLIFNKLLSGQVKINDMKIDSTAALKLNILKQVSKKNGVTEWELTAKSASLLKDEDKAVLEDVLVVFFAKEKKKVELKSDTGTLNTKTHDMTFTDNVVVTYVTATFRTDKLHYDKKEHIITSDARVRLEKSGSFIEADSMRIDLNNNRIVFEGHIQGSFNEKFNIQFQ